MTRRIADRYLLGEQIGAGGTARVHAALDERLGRRVAIKLLDARLVGSADPAGRDRFLREGPTTASFSHRHAVTVFDAGEDEGDLYIVMEIVDGPSLAERLADTGPLSIPEATRIAGQVLDALAAAHAVGIVHRDVKPANILLGADGEIKLADFGIAKRFDDLEESLTSSGTIIGTPRYLSPEQTTGSPVTPTTDVYSMGVVLFEMLAGRPPFVGDSHVAIAVAQQSQVAPDVRLLRADVPVQLAATVARALAKSPLERYPTAVEMAVDLEHSWSPPSPPAPDPPISPTQVMPPLALTAVVTPLATTALPSSSATGPGGTEIMSAAGTDPTAAPAEADSKPATPRRVVAVTVVFVLLVVGVAAMALSGNDSTDPQTAGTGSVASTFETAATVPTTAPTTAPAPTTTQVVTSPLVDEIVPGFPVTDSLAVFVRQLEEDPALVGTAGVLLVGHLNLILDENSVKQQRDKAKQVSIQLPTWVENGELDPDIADALDALLAPLASKSK